MKINVLKLLLGNLIRLYQNSWSSQKLKKTKKQLTIE